MSDNGAVLDGYTEEFMASNIAREFPILVKPGTDFTDVFRAWDMDMQEFVRIEGWRWHFTKKEN